MMPRSLMDPPGRLGPVSAVGGESGIRMGTDGLIDRGAWRKGKETLAEDQRAWAASGNSEGHWEQKPYR